MGANELVSWWSLLDGDGEMEMEQEEDEEVPGSGKSEPGPDQVSGNPKSSAMHIWEAAWSSILWIISNQEQ